MWKAQQEDSECQALYQKVVENGKVILNSNTSFNIMEDLIYHVVTLPYKTIYQLYIPASFRMELLEYFTKTPSLAILEGTKPTGDCNTWSIGRS